jgi:toxin ParE1/3/4
MANSFELTAGARKDLKEIWSYIAENNAASADKILRELAKKFDLLAQNPKIGNSHDKFIVNLRSFPFKNYHIFYFPTENGVEIYRVIHRARNTQDLFEGFFKGLES